VNEMQIKAKKKKKPLVHSFCF